MYETTSYENATKGDNLVIDDSLFQKRKIPEVSCAYCKLYRYQAS